MKDKLFVTYDKDERRNETGLCVGRETDDKVEILKMVLDEEADKMYMLLTDQQTKVDTIRRTT